MSRDSDKKNNKKKNVKKIGKNNKTGREEIRNINSMTVSYTHLTLPTIA